MKRDRIAIGSYNLEELQQKIDRFRKPRIPLKLVTPPGEIVETYKGFPIRKWGQDRYDTAYEIQK